MRAPLALLLLRLLCAGLLTASAHTAPSALGADPAPPAQRPALRSSRKVPSVINKAVKVPEAGGSAGDAKQMRGAGFHLQSERVMRGKRKIQLKSI